MLMSSRRDPPKHLALPNQSGQHLTLSQFLLHSPLPSPALPSILPRHGKKPPRLNTNRFLRYLCWVGIFTTLFVCIKQFNRTDYELGNLTYEASDGQQYEIVGTADLPGYASPVALVDKHGNARWTVSIPSGLNHPLLPSSYVDVCTNALDVSQHVSRQRQGHNNGIDWQYKDTNFVDLPTAYSSGLLAPLPSTTTTITTTTDDLPLCKKSLTYVLDSSEAGLGQMLLGLWMSYSLAKEEDRAFFIDDQNFPYGSYIDMFAEYRKTPTCRPPPWEHRTPCPRQANHLILNTATLRFIFGKSFQERHNTKDIFHMAREGFEALFKLRSDDSAYVEARVSQLRAPLDKDGKIVGIHIRRGDRHPFEFQYQHGYIPPSTYMATARQSSLNPAKTTILLASDDADIYDDQELHGTVRAQEQIRLASKKQLEQGGLGWEGGFFSDAFWNIGLPEHSTKMKLAGSPQPTLGKRDSSDNNQKVSSQENENRDYKSRPTPEARQLREYIGRAYLLDLAVLAQSDEIVCGVSSYGCRILAVMMGWDKLHGGKWKNVDGDHGWRGLF